MAKIFGLSLFSVMIAMGIFCGSLKHPLTIRMVIRVFFSLMLIYIMMGLYLSQSVAFLIPD